MLSSASNIHDINFEGCSLTVAGLRAFFTPNLRLLQLHKLNLQSLRIHAFHSTSLNSRHHQTTRSAMRALNLLPMICYLSCHTWNS